MTDPVRFGRGAESSPPPPSYCDCASRSLSVSLPAADHLKKSAPESRLPAARPTNTRPPSPVPRPPSGDSNTQIITHPLAALLINFERDHGAAERLCQGPQGSHHCATA